MRGAAVAPPGGVTARQALRVHQVLRKGPKLVSQGGCPLRSCCVKRQRSCWSLCS